MPSATLRNCTQCGAPQEDDSPACYRCGHFFAPASEARPYVSQRCQRCGMLLFGDSTECGNCGQGAEVPEVPSSPWDVAPHYDSYDSYDSQEKLKPMPMVVLGEGGQSSTKVELHASSPSPLDHQAAPEMQQKPAEIPWWEREQPAQSDGEGTPCPRCREWIAGGELTCMKCGWIMDVETNFVETNFDEPMMQDEPTRQVDLQGLANEVERSEQLVAERPVLRRASNPSQPMVVAVESEQATPPVPEPTDHIESAPTTPPAAPAAAQGHRLWVYDPSNGQEIPYQVNEAGTVLGSGECDVALTNDPYLSTNHARFHKDESGWVVSNLDPGYVIYKRLYTETYVQSGMIILMGGQLLKIDVMDPSGAYGYAQTTEGGTVLARVYRSMGASSQMFEITKEESFIGRDPGCDVAIADDPYVAEHHACLKYIAAENRFLLVESQAQAGIFLMIQDSCQLQSGDVLRMGSQTLRWE
jgi:hypothetical protein